MFNDIKDFIGKVVLSTENNARYVLKEITAPVITVRSEKANEYGCYSCYCWETINGDPISKGYLKFEEEALTELFKVAYNAYCRTQDAYWETYGYYMRRD